MASTDVRVGARIADSSRALQGGIIRQNSTNNSRKAELLPSNT